MQTALRRAPRASASRYVNPKTDRSAIGDKNAEAEAEAAAAGGGGGGGGRRRRRREEENIPWHVTCARVTYSRAPQFIVRIPFYSRFIVLSRYKHRYVERCACRFALTRSSFFFFSFPFLPLSSFFILMLIIRNARVHNARTKCAATNVVGALKCESAWIYRCK
jgi:hypothetical protein